MKKLNNYLTTGLLMAAVTMTLDQFLDLPEFLFGFLMIIAITFEFLGIYAINHDMSKVKNFKRNLIKKVMNK